MVAVTVAVAVAWWLNSMWWAAFKAWGGSAVHCGILWVGSVLWNGSRVKRWAWVCSLGVGRDALMGITAGVGSASASLACVEQVLGAFLD
eukprot:scaffold246100_cov18-Tisochrysis_lutea.AAC.2